MKFLSGILLVIALVLPGSLPGCSSSRDGTSDLEKADLAFARRDYLKAADILNKAHGKYPDNLGVITLLGECYLKLGRMERALVFFEKAGTAAPDDIDVQIKLARLYLLTLQFSEARKICGNLEKKQIIHSDYYQLQGDLAVMDGQLDIAEQYYRNAVISAKDALRALMKLAIFLKSRDRKSEAEEILAIVNKNTIASPGIFLLLADYHLLDNDFHTAETCLKKALGLEPEDLGLQYHLARFYISAGRTVQAEQMLEPLAQQQDDFSLWMMLADLYIMNNRLDKAQDLIQQLKNVVKDNAVARFELLQGKYWLYARKPAFAAAHLKSALDLQPGLVNTRYLLGLVHMINGKIKLAENKLVQTLQLDPEHHDALLLIAGLLYKKQEYSLSIKYLDAFIKRYPEDVSGYLLKGLNLLELKDYAQAEKQFLLALTLTGDTHIPLYYLGRTKETAKDYFQASAYYQDACDSRPFLVDACYRYRLMLLKTGRTELVREYVQTVQEDGIATHLEYYTAAKLAGLMHAPPLQIALLKKAIEKKPSFGTAYIALARAYQKNKQFSPALKSLKICTEKNPDYEDAWIAISRIYLEGQDPLAALEILEQAHEKIQGSPIFLSNLAWLLLENKKDVNKALALAQKAYEKLPDNIAVADTLGWAYYHKGIYSQAAWLFSDILQKVPENAMVQYHLGMTLYNQGHVGQAFHHLDLAKQAGLSPGYVQTIDTLMSELEIQQTGPADTGLHTDADALLKFPEKPDNDPDTITPQWN